MIIAIYYKEHEGVCLILPWGRTASGTSSAGCPVCFIDVLTVEKATSKQKVGHIKGVVVRVEGIIIQGL